MSFLKLDGLIVRRLTFVLYRRFRVLNGKGQLKYKVINVCKAIVIVHSFNKRKWVYLMSQFWQFYPAAVKSS